MNRDEETTYREFVRQTLLDIKAQTTKTNGRVTALEDLHEIDAIATAVFRTRIYTAITILTFLVGSVVVPVLSSYIAAGRF